MAVPFYSVRIPKCIFCDHSAAAPTELGWEIRAVLNSDVFSEKRHKGSVTVTRSKISLRESERRLARSEPLRMINLLNY